MPCCECDFSASKERCFGGIGSGCSGNAGIFAPFVRHKDTCIVDGWMSVGSILHDRCCLQTNNEGWSCLEVDKGDETRCKDVWQEAWDNTTCGRQWRQTFGPYCIGSGDNTNSDLRAPRGAKVSPKYANYCQSGSCEVSIIPDACVFYCVCQ